jgi:hypothetical protein
LVSLATSGVAHADDQADCDRYLRAVEEAHRDAGAYVQTNEIRRACASLDYGTHTLLEARAVCVGDPANPDPRKLDILTRLEVHQMVVNLICGKSCKQVGAFTDQMSEHDLAFYKKACARIPAKRPTAGSVADPHKVTCASIRAAVASGKERSEVALEMKVSKLTIDRCIAAAQH